MRIIFICIIVLLLFGCSSTPVEQEPKILCKPQTVYLVPKNPPPVLVLPDDLDLTKPDTLSKRQLVEIILAQQAYIRQYQDYLTGF